MGFLSRLKGIFSSGTHNDVTVSFLDDNDLQGIDSQAERGREFLEKYIGVRDLYEEQEIDNAIVAWRNSTEEKKEDAEFVIENVGSYLGNLLVSRDELKWCIWKDRHGADLCVTHKKVQVQTFPHSSIYKAVIDFRENALAEVTRILKEQISENINSTDIQKHEAS